MHYLIDGVRDMIKKRQLRNTPYVEAKGIFETKLYYESYK